MMRALFIVTNIDAAPNFDHSTGFDVREAAFVWHALRQHNWEVQFASVAGGQAVGAFKGGATVAIDAFTDDLGDQMSVSTTPVRTHITHAFDLLYFVGGLGCMWDFPHDHDIHALIHRALGRGARVAAICHGPAALLGAHGEDGRPLVAGRSVTAFSDAEEAKRQVLHKLPFSLEKELVGEGADVSLRGDGESHVVTDGQLITAQNPRSLPELCTALLTPSLIGRTVS